MKVSVLYFTSIRGKTGAREERFELEDESSISNLRTSICALYPDLEADLETAMFAVNREIVSSDQGLSDDDEVAIFPPISGGHTPHMNGV